MKKIEHHISDELLLEYAAGSLGEAWSVAVATHLAMCPACRERLSLMENAGGMCLDAAGDMDTSDTENSSWSALLEKLDEVPRVGRPGATSTARSKVDAAPSRRVPEPLRSYLGSDVETLKWKPLGVGAYHFPIQTREKSASIRLLRIPAGKPVPEHSHGGRELTLVLRGSFHDGDMLFGPGDFEEADSSTQHQPIATPGEDCICLAVTDAPLRFKSLLVRLVQPLIGI
jgi:putative transcriptional regulator